MLLDGSIIACEQCKHSLFDLVVFEKFPVYVMLKSLLMVEEPDIGVFVVRLAVLIEKPEDADEYGISVEVLDNEDDCCEYSLASIILERALGFNVEFRSDILALERVIIGTSSLLARSMVVSAILVSGMSE